MVDRFSNGSHWFDLLLDGPEHAFWFVEHFPVHPQLECAPHLAVDTGVGADLGRHVVDPQVLS